MIKYILKCKNKHEFESWFLNSTEFEKLKKKDLVKCIFCKSNDVEKSIMSPRIMASTVNQKDEHNLLEQNEFTKIKKDLINIKKFVEKNFEFVGDRFSQEVRNVYYDKRKKKNIYGNATKEEKQELKEEGIELTTIPWIDNKEN